MIERSSVTAWDRVPERGAYWARDPPWHISDLSLGPRTHFDVVASRRVCHGFSNQRIRRINLNANKS
jgi:hypothetical protein